MTAREKFLALWRYRMTRREWILYAAALLLAVPFAVVVWTMGYSTPSWLFTIAPALFAVLLVLIVAVDLSICRNAWSQAR